MSFQKFKYLCSSMPILAYADYSKPFMLHTDMCGFGLGMVLYEKEADGTNRVIAYTSHTLSKSVRNCPSHKLEFLTQMGSYQSFLQIPLWWDI